MRLGHIEGLSTDELTALLDKAIAVIEKTTAKITIDHKGLGYSQNRRVYGQRLCLLFSQISVFSVPMALFLSAEICAIL